MPSTQPPRCPKCGSTDEFGVEMNVLTGSNGKVVGVNEHGSLIIEWYSAHDPLRFHRPKLECVDCGHWWTTSRQWVSEITNA